MNEALAKMAILVLSRVCLCGGKTKFVICPAG